MADEKVLFVTPPPSGETARPRPSAKVTPGEGGTFTTAPPSEEPGIAEDIAKATGSGIARGFVGTAGLPGDIAQLYRLGAQYVPFAARKAGEAFGFNAPGEAEQKLEAAKRAAAEGATPEERAGTHARVLGMDLPTSKGMVEYATKQGVPGLEYEAATPYGRIAGTVGEFIGGGAPLGGAGGLISGGLRGAARSAVRESVGLPNVLAGVGAGAAHEYLPNMPGAEIAGALAGARAGSLRAGKAEREAIAKGLTGDILRKEAGVTQVPPMAPGTYLPGAGPTPQQLMPQNPRLAGLTREVAPERSSILAHEARTEIGSEAAKQAGALPAPRPLHETLALVGDNPQASSSVRAREPFNVVHDKLKAEADLAWKHPVISEAQINVPPLRTAIGAMEKKLGPGMSALDSNLTAYLEYFRNAKGTVPAEYIQNALSTAKENLREGRGDSRSTREFIAAFNPVLENVDNVSKRFMPQGVLPNQFSDAWKDAVSKTRQYETLFGVDDKIFGQLRKRYGEGAAGAGANVLPSETTLDKLLAGKNAGDNYRRLSQFFDTPTVAGNYAPEARAAMQRDLQSSVADWAVSKLSANGQKIITDADLQKFMKDPGYASLVSQVPGLEQRLKTITARAGSEQLVGDFRDVLNSNNPARIADFISANGSELRAALPGQNPRALAQLQKSAEVWSRLSQGKLDERRLTDLLQQGDIFTVLHGVAMGRAMQGALAYGATKFAGLPAIVPAVAEIAGAAGLGGYLGGAPGHLMSRLMYGDVQAAATKLLQKALEDPATMRELLKAPSVENIRNPLSIPGMARYMEDAALAGAKYGYLAERGLGDQAGGLTIPIYGTPTGAPRPGRKAGGRIGSLNHAGIAASLIRAAEKAKKGHNTTTEPLLDQPDEAITKALAIANEALDDHQ